MAENGSVVVNVKGATLVHVSTGSGGAFTYLGYTRDGVMLTPEAYWVEVKSDDNGGESGPPSEIQYIGETSRIRCELTKFDATNAQLIQTRLNPHNWSGFPGATQDQQTSGGAVGQPPPAGTLVFANFLTWAVALQMQGVPQFDTGNLGSATQVVRIYPRCLPRHGVEFNVGTKFSTFVVEFEAFKTTNGILFYEVSALPSGYMPTN